MKQKQKPLSKKRKKEIEMAVKLVVKEYGDVLKAMAKT